MKQQTKIITIILSIISLLMLHSIAYSALSTTMNISGQAYARVESDIRITNFKISTTEQNAISQYEQFNKEQIQSEITLPTASSTITYDVEITNYGSEELGIYQITGLPTELTYEITNYQLKTKLCDENNKCNLGAKKIISIKISYNTFVEDNTSYKLNLSFEFKPIYKVTYQNITNNNFPSYIMQGETININIIEDFLPVVKISDSKLSKNEYTYQNKNLIIANIQGPVEISVSNIVGEYEYTGNYQTFIVPKSGTYKIELWGASGNNNYNQYTKDRPSYGGYTSGEIQLAANEILYIYVGGQKKQFNMATQVGSTGGGGATDIRLVSGSWNEFTSLSSRIMVAGGSGGNYYDSSAATGGHGGGLMSTAVAHTSHPIHSATQTSGGKAGLKGTDGTFGIGGTNTITAYNSGGGGYFGGGSAPGSGGGSSFISGHNGCVAITEDSTENNIIQRNDSTGTICTDGTTDITCSYHYSNKIFTNTTMIDGGGYVWTTEKAETSTGMPTYDATSTMIGNDGNGFAKISLISTGTDVIDTSGNNKNGTSNNISYSSEGAVFNGSSSYMEYPNDLDIEFPITYAFKVKINDIPDAEKYTNAVIFGDVQTNAGFGYRYVTEGYVINIKGHAVKVVSSAGMEFGKFHTYHLVYGNNVYEPTLYRDGVKLSTINESNNWTWTGANSTIGKRIQGTNSSNSYLNGSIEYFMIYNKALSEEEIAINNQATNKSDFTTDELKLFYYFK